MSRLESYLAHPLAEAVGWVLLHSLWQGALVALVFAGTSCFCVIETRSCAISWAVPP